MRVIDGRKGRVSDPLDELSYGKPVRQHVREFGAVMALLACIIAYFQEHTHHVGLTTAAIITAVGLFVYTLGIVAPAALKPAWQGWMKFAHYLGIVMTSVILTATWVGMVIPLGFAVRLFRVKIMDMRFRAPVQSYWEERPAGMEDFKLLERQW